VQNQIFITFDSLRYDVFEAADLPFMKSLGEWRKAWTHGTYTLPAHMSFFIGKLPVTYDDAPYYDAIALKTRPDGRGLYRASNQLWRLENPEFPKPGKFILNGANIIDGFNKIGFRTVGTGAVNWFNPELLPCRPLLDHFQRFRFFGPMQSGVEQVEWALKEVRACRDTPYFLFLNFGETHHPFKYPGCDWWEDNRHYGHRELCLERQRGCLEYLDPLIRQLLAGCNNYDLVICSDHGEVLGEDGLWGHGVYHEAVMAVPILYRVHDPES
jgi:hypothetical protein